MNCTGCQYPLWNIRNRVCPECGKPFRPSDFEFVPNTVQFQCPHCAQSYYGTDSRGHLVPRAFACVSCGKGVDMDDMVLLPTTGVAERRTRPISLPWTDPGAGGWFKRFFKTTGLAFARPRELIAAARQTSTASAWRFFLLVGLISFLVWTLPLFALMLAVAGVGTGLVVLGGLGVLILAGLALLVFWPLGSHATLRLTGRRGEGLGATVRAIAYSSPVHCISWIPCVGMYVFFLSIVYHVVLACIMMHRAHQPGPGTPDRPRVGGARATFAIILPPIVAFVVIVGGYAIAMVSAIRMSTAAVAAAAAAASGQTIVTSAAGALRTHHAATGDWPGHAIELLAPSGTLSPLDYVVWSGPFMAFPPAPASASTAALSSQVTIARHSLDQIALLSPEERAALEQAARDSLEPGWIAHRVGDVVFTYAGVPLDSPRWIAIESWDPTLHPGQAQPVLAVALADGTTTTIQAALFARDLAIENQSRAAIGLGPIPDPATVK